MQFSRCGQLSVAFRALSYVLGSSESTRMKTLLPQGDLEYYYLLILLITLLPPFILRHPRRLGSHHHILRKWRDKSH